MSLEAPTESAATISNHRENPFVEQSRAKRVRLQLADAPKRRPSSRTGSKSVKHKRLFRQNRFSGLEQAYVYIVLGAISTD